MQFRILVEAKHSDSDSDRIAIELAETIRRIAPYMLDNVDVHLTASEHGLDWYGIEPAE